MCFGGGTSFLLRDSFNFVPKYVKQVIKGVVLTTVIQTHRQVDHPFWCGYHVVIASGFVGTIDHLNNKETQFNQRTKTVVP